MKRNCEGAYLEKGEKHVETTGPNLLSSIEWYDTKSFVLERNGAVYEKNFDWCGQHALFSKA